MSRQAADSAVTGNGGTTAISDLDLPYLALEEAEFAADPAPRFAAARAQHEWLATCSFGYVVHGYEAIKALLWMDDRLNTGYDGIVELMQARGTPWGRFQEESILTYQGAAHRKMRDILAPAFTPRQANRARPLMRKVASKLLDEWAPRGSFDFEEFASYFPITVMCALIGASADHIPSLRASMEAMGLSLSMDRKYLPMMQQAVEHLEDFSRQLVAARRNGERPGAGPDLLDALITANDQGGLTDLELTDLLIFLFVAGYDTSKNALTLMMHALLDRPEEYARCAADAGYCRKVVEENFRFHTTATIPRRSREDVVYRGVFIPKETMLFFPVSMAGRDPSAIADPDDFRPDREQVNRHMAFGRGVHICLGQYIARAQLEEGLHLIARRLTNPKRAGPSDWRPFYGVWGLRGLPIACGDSNP